MPSEERKPSTGGFSTGGSFYFKAETLREALPHTADSNWRRLGEKPQSTAFLYLVDESLGVLFYSFEISLMMLAYFVQK